MMQPVWTNSGTSNVMHVLLFHQNTVALLKHCKEVTVIGPMICRQPRDMPCSRCDLTLDAIFFSFYLKTTSEQKSTLNRTEKCYAGMSYRSRVILSLTAGVCLTLNPSRYLRCLTVFQADKNHQLQQEMCSESLSRGCILFPK